MDGPEELEVEVVPIVVEVVAPGDVVVSLDEDATVEALVDDVMDVVLVDSEAVVDVADWPESVV